MRIKGVILVQFLIQKINPRDLPTLARSLLKEYTLFSPILPRFQANFELI